MYNNSDTKLKADQTHRHCFCIFWTGKTVGFFFSGNLECMQHKRKDGGIYKSDEQDNVKSISVCTLHHQISNRTIMEEALQFYDI